MVPGVFSKKNYFNQTVQDVFFGNRCSIRLLRNIFHRWDFRGHRPGTVPGWKPCRTMDDSVHHIHLTRSGRICVKKDNISKFNLNARFHVNISLLLKLKVWEFSKFYCLFGLKFFRFNSKILKHLCLFFLCSSTNRCSAAWCQKTGCFYRVVNPAVSLNNDLRQGRIFIL